MRKVLLWCGAVLAFAVSNTANAQCAVSTFPYLEDFDGPTWGVSSTFDPCWPKSAGTPTWTVDNNTTGSSDTGPAGDKTGGNYLYLEATSGSSGAIAYVETPYFDLTGLTNPVVSFYYHRYGANMGDMFIEASLDSGATWCEVYRISGQTHFATTDPWLPDSANLTDVKSAYTKLRFASQKGSSFRGDNAIDSVAVYNSSVAVCPPPICLNTIAVGSTTVDFEWVSSGTTFTYEVVPSGTSPGTGGSVATGSPLVTMAQGTGLTPATAYDIYVRNDCGGGLGSSDWAGPLSVVTTCVTITTYPYTENFDGVTWSSTVTYDPCWTFNATSGYRWQVNSGSTGSGSTGPSSDASGSGQYIYVEASSSGGEPTAQLPELDLSSLTSPEMEFSYHMYGAQMGTLYIEASVDTGGTWTLLDSLVGPQHFSSADPWLVWVTNLTSVKSAYTLVRFRTIRGSGLQGDASIDEVTVQEAPPCPRPTFFSAFNIGSTTADVTFTALGSTYIVEWGPQGYTQGTGMITTSTNDTIALSGLPDGTCVDVYIQSDCSSAGNGLSVVAGPFTICTAYIPDYLENYDGGYPPFDFLEATGVIDGGSITYGSSNWLQDNFANVSGSSTCARVNISGTGSPHQWMVSPAIDLGTGNSYNLEYDVAWTESFSGTLDAIIGVDDTVHVLISTDNGMTWDRSNIITSYHQGNPITLAGSHEVFDLTGYSGIVRIGFYSRSTVTNESTDFFIDNLEVRTPPACQEPFGLTVTYLTDSTASIVWTADTTATGFDIEWGETGFAQGTGTIVTGTGDSAFLTGLPAATTIDVYVSIDCSNGSSSVITGPFSFTTLCPPYFSAPYLEDFTLTSYGQATNGGWENCWTTPTTTSYRWESEDASGANENSSDTGPHYDNTTFGTSGGGYMFTEASSAGPDAILLSPTIELSALTTPTLTFAYHMYGAQMGTMHVDVWNGSMWVDDVFVEDGEQQTAGDDPWLNAEVPLAAFIGDTIQIRWRGEHSGTVWRGDISIDDVNIDDGPSCSSVTGGFAENLTSSSGDLNWSAFGTSFDIEWGPCGFTPATGVGTVVTGVTQGYTLSSLQPNTCYEFYVINTCDPSGTQYGPFEFTTACIAPLNGVYTVGGPVGPNNFADLDTAMAALVCGVSGPVTYQIVGSHSVSSSLYVGDVPGLSATNTLTFDGISTSTGSVSGTSTNGIFFIDNTSHISIRNLTIVDSGATNSVGIRIVGDADSITIQDNIIWVDQSNTASSNGGIAITNSPTSLTTAGSDADYISIRNNSIRGGYYGIAAYGISTTVKVDDIEIENNTMINQYYYGMRVQFYDGAQVNINYVDSLRNTFSYAYYYSYVDNLNMSGNYGRAITMALYANGQNRYDTTAVNTYTNNMLVNDGSTTNTGVNFTTSSQNVNFYHNSVRSNGYGIRDFGTVNYDYRNNIFYGGNLAIDMSVAPTANEVLDYNLLYTTGATLAEMPTAYADLAALQAASAGHNQNSVSGDPIFDSPTDLHLAGALANDVGDNSVGVLVDYDGDVRPASGSTVVDMGADEFTPLLWDANAIAIFEPTNGGCGDSAVQVSVIVQNLGLNDITSIEVHADVSGDVTANLLTTYATTIPSVGIDTVVVGTFNIYNGGSVSVFGYVNLTNDGDNSNDTTSTVSADYISFEPIAISGGDTACAGDSIDLIAQAQSGVIHGWFANMADTVPAFMGDTVTVPVDPAQTTYYLGYVTSGLDSLQTTFADNNGCGGGNMFDMTVNNGIVWEGVAVNSGSGAGTSVDVSIWYLSGSYIGNETNAAAWTLHETVTTTSAGTGNATRAMFSAPLVLPAGAYGIYIEYNARYTNATSTYSNGDLSLSLGVGLCNQFGGLNNGRVWNGRIIYRGSNSCSQDKIPVSFNINPLPVASFTSTGGTYGSGAYVFDATATTDADSIFWDLGDGNTANGTVVNHTYANNDTLDVMMIAFNDCGSDTAYAFDQPVYGIGLSELSGVQNLRMYPNPSSGAVSIEMALDKAQEINLEILNLQGQVLFTENLGRVEGEFVWNGDISQLPKGAYFVRLTGNSGVKTLPLTLQ